jgi:hypothetical protein
MVAEAVRHLLPGDGRRPYTEDELAEADDVLDAAVEWQAGNLPIRSFMQIGTLPPKTWTHKAGVFGGGVEVTCRGLDRPGYTRFVALVWAIKTHDPRRAALMAALDAAADAGLISARPEGV